ncbi:ECF transporter S component [Agrilactobacillus fermenti]|uniref:ECF transporter S component n=1 Tax=Agrilactobacillus fermenti TaxID=2586909 RepID=UPI003A5BCC6C
MKQWHLREIIMLTLLSIFLGVIFWVTGPIYNVLAAALTPFGLAPAANDLLLGLWVMAGPLAGFMIRIPGSATLGEFLGAVVEMFLGGQWGAATMISGIVQGVASEAGFALVGYKKYNWLSLSLSVLTTTVLTFVWDLFRSGYGAYKPGMLVMLFFLRLLSIFVFGGILTKLIVSLLERSHMIQARQV